MDAGRRLLARCFAGAWLGVVVCLALGVTVPAEAGPRSQDPPGGPRVRPTDALAARILRDGMIRSATLRALVDRLEQGHVVVYVGMAPRQSRHVAGAISWLADAGALRYLSIGLNPGLLRLRLVVSLAHELRHAVEVDDRPDVRSPDAFVALYQSIGHVGAVGAGSWDTQAATDVSAVVLAEATMAVAPDEPRGRFGPPEWHAWYREVQAERMAREVTRPATGRGLKPPGPDTQKWD